ncbi:MAG: metal ABC transporter solute-binding protein, Zn/Mn family [Patescibacteria group bacterium]
MKKMYFVLAVLVLVFLGIVLFREQASSENADRISVTASFFPLAEIVRNVGQEQVTVVQIVENGANIHDYEPSSAAVGEVISSELFLFNGYELDPWAENIVPHLEAQEVAYLEAATVVEGRKTAEAHEEDHHDDSVEVGNEEDHTDEHHDDEHHTDEHHESEHHEYEEGHHHGEYDPHIWLSIDNMILITEAVRDELSTVDPDNAEVYQANASEYIKELQTLAKEYEEGLAQCTHREAVVSHDAYSYLGDDYDISFIPVAGLSPHDEPSSMELAELVEIVRKHNLEHVYMEPFATRAFIDTIASETGAEVLLLNPASGLTKDQQEGTETYTTIMKKNLTQLQIGLQCEI